MFSYYINVWWKCDKIGFGKECHKALLMVIGTFLLRFSMNKIRYKLTVILRQW